MSAASNTSQFATTAKFVLNQSIPRLIASRLFTPHPHRDSGNCPPPKDRPPWTLACVTGSKPRPTPNPMPISGVNGEFRRYSNNQPHCSYFADLQATGGPEETCRAGAKPFLRQTQSALTAGHAHVARQCRLQMPAVDHKIMPLRLPRDVLVDRRIQEVVTLGRAQRLAQIGSVVLTETHIERAGAGDTNAIARLAEVMRQRRNKSETSAGFFYTHITGGTSGPFVDVFERISLRQSCTHDRQWQVLIETRFIDVTQRHDLDHGEIHTPSVRPLEQIDDLIFVHPFEGNGVDLDLKTLRLR